MSIYAHAFPQVNTLPMTDVIQCLTTHAVAQLNTIIETISAIQHGMLMRFTRLYPGKDGQQCASIQMYESEAAEMIWQLLSACTGIYPLEKEYKGNQ